MPRAHSPWTLPCCRETPDIYHWQELTQLRFFSRQICFSRQKLAALLSRKICCMRCCDDKDLTIKPIRIFVSQKSQLWQLQPMIHIHLEHSMNAPEILAYTFKTFIHSTTGKAPQRSTFTQKSAIPLQGRLHNAPQSPRTLPFHYREGSTTLHIHPELCHSTTGKLSLIHISEPTRPP